MAAAEHRQTDRDGVGRWNAGRRQRTRSASAHLGMRAQASRRQVAAAVLLYAEFGVGRRHHRVVEVGGVANANAPRGPLIDDGPRATSSVLRVPGSRGRVRELWSCKLNLLDAPAQRHRQLPWVERVDTHAAHKVAPARNKLGWHRQLQRDTLVRLGIVAAPPAHLVLTRPKVGKRRSVALRVSSVSIGEDGFVGRQSCPEFSQRTFLRARQRRCSSCCCAIQREGLRRECGCDTA